MLGLLRHQHFPPTGKCENKWCLWEWQRTTVTNRYCNKQHLCRSTQVLKQAHSSHSLPVLNIQQQSRSLLFSISGTTQINAKIIQFSVLEQTQPQVPQITWEIYKLSYRALQRRKPCEDLQTECYFTASCTVKMTVWHQRRSTSQCSPFHRKGHKYG